MGANICEEQVPIGSQEGFMLSLSPDGVVHPVEPNVNTQQSCNVNSTLNLDEAWDALVEEEDGEDVDKSSSDFEIERGDFSGKNCL